jgi:uncharacterized RmlC-like cupin family protein
MAADGSVRRRGGQAVAEVVVIPASELGHDTAQTPGLQRLEAVSAAMAGSSSIWMGLSVLPAGARTGVHHHGESETAIYIRRGTGRWWIGEKLDEPHEAHPGDFVFIPPYVVHWEENASATEPVEMIVSRSTQEAIVVNLDDRTPAHLS